MKDEKLVCPICGEPTFIYFGNPRKDRLCAKHGQMARAGEIVQCPDCGQWHKKDEDCKCEETNKKTMPYIKSFPSNNRTNDFDRLNKGHKSCIVCGEETPNGKLQCDLDKKEPEQEQKNKKCLLCDNESGEYLFCKACFARYRNKTLLLKVTVDQNQKLELLDESYEGLYVCKDGHVVKSKSERDIDNYLFINKIAHAYEKALIVGSETFHPDFYLPELDLYIEHWGYDENNIEYTKRKEYKLPKYKEKGITLISTYEKDMKDVDTSLEIKLNTYKKGALNFIE